MTAGGRRVTVFAKSTAVSVTPVRPGKTYPFSALDQAMARHTVHLLFYYRPGPAMDRDRLKESLSEVLSHYPAATGRLARGEADGCWAVKCTDAGVRLLDATVDATLDGWMASATDEEEMELVHWEPMGEDPSIWSPFYLQITEFSDKAFALGLSCPHLHADPTCAALLVKAWSDAHRRAAIVYPPFFHPPAFLPRLQPHPSSSLLSLKASLSSTSSSPSPAMSSAAFRFSSDSVKALLADVNAGSGDTEVTPFAALAALFWSRIAARAEHAAKPAPADLTLAVDFRKRMHAPLPHGFYGNAFHFSQACADLGSGVGGVAGAVARHVAAMGEEEFWEAVEWLHERRAGGLEPFQMYGPELTFAAVDHVMAYGAEFEAGVGPAHVTLRVGGVDGEGGLVAVLPVAAAGAEGETGRAVAVTLPAEVTKELCKDEAILKYGRTLMFAPRG